MSLISYSRYRRMELRNAWSLAGMGEWCREVGKYIAAFLAAMVLVSCISDAATAADEADMQRQRAERMQSYLEDAWLSCLNGNGIWLDGKLHTCSVADTGFAPTDFKRR